MEVVMLGTGGPYPDGQRSGSAIAISHEAGWYLFDTGRGAVNQYVQAGLPLQELATIFLTHLHFDHISDLADVMFSSWMLGRRHPLCVLGPTGVDHLVDTLVEDLYALDIEFREQGEGKHGAWIPVRPQVVVPGEVLSQNGTRIVAAPMLHRPQRRISGFGQRWQAFGYRVEQAGRAVVFSGDTAPTKRLVKLARGANMLIVSSWMPCARQVTEYDRRVGRMTLAGARDVGRMASEAEVDVVVLTHLRSADAEFAYETITEVEEEFSGKVILAKELDRFSV